MEETTNKIFEMQGLTINKKHKIKIGIDDIDWEDVNSIHIYDDTIRICYKDFYKPDLYLKYDTNHKIFYKEEISQKILG